MSIITYHEWAKKAGYNCNENWTDLPDARKMLRRRDKLLDKGQRITADERMELDAYDDYWMMAFEYGLNSIEEVVKFKTDYGLALFEVDETDPKYASMKNQFQTDITTELYNNEKFITTKPWERKKKRR